ncbi:MAG TPA: hypothetical protein VMV33_03450, partial [Rhodocyclaceae bacterium]|nr:hypothetical protein [Rhodocyclaceae bacterium]
VLLQGPRVMREVAFFHHASKTLILVDLVENVTAATPGTNWLLRLLFRMIGMWNTPSPAPEYRLGWGDKALVRQCMMRILQRDFERVTRRGGHVSMPGVYAGFIQAFMFGDAFEKGLTMKMGQTHVQRFLPELLDHIENGDLQPDVIISHRMKLADAAEGYKMFNDQADLCRKVVLTP